MNKFKLSAIILGGVFLFIVVASASFAQTSDDDHLIEEVVLKVNGLNPALGVTFPVSETTKFRALGFFSINLNPDTFGSNHSYYLDLSYLTFNNWMASESVETYWGIDLMVVFEDPVIAPGALAGISYNLSEDFAVFGEAGLNLFINLNYDAVYLAMFNSGIGIKVAL